MKTKPDNKPSLHPVVICGDDKGGVTKSTSCAAVADALMALGYKVRMADGDTANRTLSLINPAAEKIDCRNTEELSAFIAGGPESGADISLIDMPGSSGDLLTNYFTETGFETFRGLGVRIIIALTLTQTPDSVRGALAWIRTFYMRAEIVVFANQRDTPPGQPFSLDEIPSGARVYSLAEGRAVHIPRWSDYMTKHYKRPKGKGMPSDYMVGGRVYKALNLNPLSVAPWQMHHRRVTASVANVAEWLTGKPAPLPAPEIEEDTVSPEKAKLLAELQASYEE
jgi:hypothetical protein